MPPQSLKRTIFILIAALLLIQGAAAQSFEQAPLNPAFVTYTEWLETGAAETDAATGIYDATTPAQGAPYPTGLLPSPVTLCWPDAYTAPAVTDAAALPARFDLRDEGRITPVRDQGKCGSCWAFATYGSLESTYLTDTGVAEDFSEKNMNNLCSDEYVDGFDCAPCKGGFAFMSDAYLVRGSGPIQEADDPYALPVPSNISPTDLSPVLDVSEVTFIPQRTGPLDNDLFKEQLMNEGAIWVGFYINWSCFADNYSTYYWPGDEEEYALDGGHAVTLVGWDDAFPKESFAVEPPGDGAFILKNSWGTDIGEDGFFYISYYDPIIGTFGEEQEFVMDNRSLSVPGAVYTGVPADEDRHIYQYDPLGWTTSAGTEKTGPLYGANVFTANDYESLTEVSFYTREPDTAYTVTIFTDFTTPPGDDTPVTWTSGTCSLPGYHTISLPEGVFLWPGEVFSVVLSLEAPTDLYPLAIEMPIEGYSSGAMAFPGESYVSEDGGETWEDLTEIIPDTNLCIKAFTHSLTVVPEDYPTIQEAINASVSGDTIVVENDGMYTEELVIDKPLTLFGTGNVVLATPPEGTGILIEADNVTVTGFMVDGEDTPRGKYGMKVEGDNCTISDCQVTGHEYGLCLPSVEGLSLSDTNVYDNDINLMYENPDLDPGNAIAETVTVNGRPVIYREGVSGETIDASSDAGAVILENCTDMTIRDTATDAIAYGYYLCGCDGLTLENVSADEVDFGLGVLFSENVIIRDSTFGPDARDGMLLLGNDGLLVDRNEITASEEGIFLMSVDNLTIRDNDISTDGYGIFGFECINGSISGNTITENPERGIWTTLGISISIRDNTVDASNYGIITSYIWDLQATGNTVRCNDTGMGIIALADGAEISLNTAENCSAPALMELNNSVVFENHFSGGMYPDIVPIEGGGEVYVYRNDFVLTDNMPEGGILSTTDAIRMPAAASMDAIPAFCASGSVAADTLPAEWSTSGQWSAMDAAMTVSAVPDPSDEQNVTWHSPTEEGYYYNGQPFTGFMGNYWSTYTGNDTTMDGIGDTPFVYLNETRDTFPLVKPTAWYPNEDPSFDNEDASAGIAASPGLNAGDSVTLSFTGTAVQTVTVTAADGTGRILLVIDEADNGPTGLPGPVYQYLNVHLNGMTDDEIKEAVFSFRIPSAWLKAEGLLPVDIALYRYHDGAWKEIPATIVREEGGWVYFTAKTPGFSTFAIAGGAIENLVMETDASETGGETADVGITVTADHRNETAAEPEPPVTVAVPEAEFTGTQPEDATTPQESPIGILSVIAGAGACAAVLFRRR